MRPMSRNSSSVQAMECEVRMTFSIAASGELALSGSFSNTSSAAPAILPFCKASISAASSTIGPRAVLMSTASGFISANCGLPSKPRVCGVSGQLTST